MRKGDLFAVAMLVGLAMDTPAALGANATVETGATATAPPTFFFTPKEVTVDPGNTVTVVNGTNGGGAPHSIVWADGAPGFAPTAAPSPTNVAAWSSARTFTAPGDYAFSCTFHPLMMTGVVHVTAPAGPAPAPAPQTGAPSADRTAPALTGTTARATRRTVTVRLRLSEPAKVTVVVTRNGRRLARKRFTRSAVGAATLRVPVRARRGEVRVGITAVDAAGNSSRRTLRVRVR